MKVPRRAVPVSHSLLATSLCSLVFGCLSLAAPLLAYGDASVGEYDTYSCSSSYESRGEARGSSGWAHWSEARDENHVEACPDVGIGFDIADSMSSGQSFAWEYLPDRNMGLTGVTIGSTEGDSHTGFVYTISTCRGCAPLFTLDTPNGQLSVGPQTFVFERAPEIIVTGRCMLATCAPAAGLRIKDIKFTVSDIAAPVVDVQPLVRISNLGEVLSRARFDDWNRPDEFGFQVDARDSGVGFGNGTAIIDDQPFAPLTGACWLLTVHYGRTAPCPVASDHLVSTIVNHGIGDGRHELKVIAEDAVGNRGETDPVTFFIDGTPPPEPEKMVVSDENQFGWHSDPVVDVDWINPAPDSGSGVVLTHYDLDPLTPGLIDPQAVWRYGSLSRIANLRIPTDGDWRLDVWLEDAVGNLSPRHHQVIRIDGDQPSAPVLIPNMTVGAARLLGGYRQVWLRPVVNPALASGICGFSMAVDRAVDSVPPPDINVTDDVDGAIVPHNLPAGVNYVHVRAISCAGRASANTATTMLAVDDAPPVVTLSESPSSAAPSDGWHTRRIELTIEAIDEMSQVDHVFFELDGARTDVSGPKAQLTLSTGDHELIYGAADAAGNQSTPLRHRVRIDANEPRVWLDQRDPSRPTQIEGSVEDDESGVSSAWLQYQRVDAGASADETTWKSFGQPVRPDAFGGRAVRIVANLPDEQLPDGVYAVRLVAFDVAGNVARSGRTRPDGEYMLVGLPARPRPVLTAGIARPSRRCFLAAGGICGKASGCSRANGKCTYRMVIDRASARPSVQLPFAAAASVMGELRLADGDPVAGARLKIYAAPKNARAELVGEAFTGPDGLYEFAIAPGTTRTFVVRYTGADATAAVDSVPAVAYVRAGVTLRASKRVLGAGSAITLTGRLLTGGTDIPDGGKLISVEVHGPSGRLRSSKNVYAGLDGRFGASFTAPRTHRHALRLRIRALVPVDVSWPFIAGSSRSTYVTVRP